ncbi:iron transporter [Acidovorax sp. CCYZU-2555]|uniref:iron transporter n=1 Tax=Acidovorax sp. CCYZU-2555 TaxID=2835042 RepID=UPI001BCE189B|nr:iron transporter [Acidovorax sp. CCYZU-2555]MBS7779972.1 iron transporter [Acidovorax sp. CCYZU-2555]
MNAARWTLASRCLAAALGGYALASSLPVAIVALVASDTLARADAALVALQLSFAVYTGAVVWAFAARSAALAWAALALATLLSSGLAWALL